ncbi:hypothetical protein FGIG_02231 [Fasciola gigantica]|uniref:G-protein coupled receptors family 1 profile domain-containing protein n=1 Tax=Fasciola gigantica TaxID=46835 RepID=A0A504WV83_FASGI|nr:hypothetical protein FGIG_02231 [Fasciola gigantica]
MYMFRETSGTAENNDTSEPLLLNHNESLLPELLPSAETYVILKHYVSLPIFITSIVCILVTIVIVTRRGLWRLTVTYVVMLAIVDLLVLLLLSILSLDYFLIPLTSEQFRMWFYSAETVLGETADTLLFISNWLTAMLATERYVAICHPLHSRRIRHKHRRIVVAMVILCSVLIRIPGFVLLNMSNDYMNYPNVVIFQRCYVWIVQVILFLIVPFALLTFVNLRLIQAVRRSSKLLRATYGAEVSNSCKAVPSSRPNSASEPSNQTSERRQFSKLASTYFKCRPAGRSVNHDESIGERLPRNSVQECGEMSNLDGPLSCVNSKNYRFPSTKMLSNQYAIALTLHGPSGIHLHRASREERKITVTLVCLVITFFIFQGPSVLTSVLIRFTSSSKSVIFENLLIPLSLIALAIKSDLYFFLYCWFCERFLNSLCNLFRLRKFRDWIRRVRKRYKSHADVKQSRLAFPHYQKPSLLQEFQLPHHHYGHYGKNASLYLHGSFPHNRYRHSYKPPPLPFVMDRKRRFPLLSPQMKWNWKRHKEEQIPAVKQNKPTSFHGPPTTNIHTDSELIFVPPPDSYFSKRRVVLIPDPRSHSFSRKTRRQWATFPFSEQSSTRRSVFPRPKLLRLGRRKRHMEVVRQMCSRTEASSSTATDSNGLHSGDAVIPGESVNLISSNSVGSYERWLPVGFMNNLSRTSAVVPRDTGIVSAPVSTVIDVCVHRDNSVDTELHPVTSFRTRNVQLTSRQVANFSEHDNSVSTWQ